MSQYAVSFYSAKDKENMVAFQALSSGEQMIVMLILWSFNEKLGELKKLLILDEPDAHLHPQMAKMFIEIISDVLVKEFGIQIIMTTHSPTTLCWINEHNIFLMDPQKGLITTSKQEALDKLTSGLLYVRPSLKLILVEDSDDQLFHQKVYNELAYMDIISKNPILEFKSVVTDVNGGGKSVVKKICAQWNEFSSQTDLNSILFGLVDKDHDENSDLPSNVHALSRYCHENYFADPLLIFVLMIEEQIDNEQIHDIANAQNYRRGETLKFKNNIDVSPQVIIDRMVKVLVNSSKCALTAEQTTDKIKIKYMNGMEAQIPKHFLTESGKDIVLGYYKQVFEKGAARMNINKMTDVAITTHLIPADLIDIYKKYL